MQRIVYGVISLLVIWGLLVFLLPVLLFIIAIFLIFGLISMFTGRASFRIYTPQRPRQNPPPNIDPSVIDITEDQEK
ncbi:MAG: hypothetical protein ACRC9L_00470 [Brevinema sp.]